MFVSGIQQGNDLWTSSEYLSVRAGFALGFPVHYDECIVFWFPSKFFDNGVKVLVGEQVVVRFYGRVFLHNLFSYVFWVVFRFSKHGG